MNLFGRKRYQARQEQRAEAYQLGIDVGRALFAACDLPSVGTQEKARRHDPYSVGVLTGWQSAHWEFEDEANETLEKIGKSVVREAEEILRGAA